MHKLRLEVDTRWVEGNGYRPIRVKLLNYPPGPSKKDRKVTVRLVCSRYQNAQSVSQNLFLPAGSSEVVTDILVPQYRQWHDGLQLEVTEGSRRLEQLCAHDISGAMSEYDDNYTEVSPSVLFIDSRTPERAVRTQWISSGAWPEGFPYEHTLPNFRNVAAFFPYGNMYRTSQAIRSNNRSILTDIESAKKYHLLPMAELPSEWLGYTTLDMIFISLADTRLLQEQYPEKWDAICRWVSAGQTLMIYGVGDDFAALSEIDLSLGYDPPQENTWKDPDPTLYRSQVDALKPTTLKYSDFMPRYNSQGEQVEVSEIISARAAISPLPEALPFRLRRLQQGAVIAIASDDPFNLPPAVRGWLFNSLGSDYWMWRSRHGQSQIKANSFFGNLLIPGVGKAPVLSFACLITVFVIAVGPLNFFLVRRLKRPYLSLVTVPAAAVLVTVGLIGFALLTDGIGMRARVRSLTHIDQQRSQAVSWSRQTYYASLAPSGGLTYPATAAVYPIANPFTQSYDQNDSRKRSLLWTDQQQKLASGYITSRDAAQFLVVDARPTEHALEVVPHRDPKSAPDTKNRLGARIRKLLLRDKRGAYWQGENTADGDMVALTSTTAPLAQVEFQKLLKLVEPRQQQVQMGRSRNYYYRRYSNIDDEFPPASFETSVLERGLGIWNTSDPAELAPATYWAIVDDTPDAPLGARSPRQVLSLHVITGSW
ncbi:hypothetical protein [Lignipirellula cremea]|uniref:hypothetical protein n=1 Tax=Lignipirellula cremea TaxID=2528010 RepID=UPI0011A77FF9|nr:hypothetical protein [Lignipirellula cremea]